jgi:hypothetical protein
MKQKTKIQSLAMAIAKQVVEKKRTGKDSVRRANAVREAFTAALNERVKRMLTEKREALRNSSHLWETLEQNESFLDGIKAIGSMAAGAVGNAVASGLGVDGKKVGMIVRAFKKKKGKQYDVSKVKRKKKVAPSHDHGNVVKMDRSEFNEKIKAAGGNLKKVSSLS